MVFDIWMAGSIFFGLGSAAFGLAKGVHDKKVSEQKQMEAIDKAVNNHFERQNQMPSKEND